MAGPSVPRLETVILRLDPRKDLLVVSEEQRLNSSDHRARRSLILQRAIVEKSSVIAKKVGRKRQIVDEFDKPPVLIDQSIDVDAGRSGRLAHDASIAAWSKRRSARRSRSCRADSARIVLGSRCVLIQVDQKAQLVEQMIGGLAGRPDRLAREVIINQDMFINDARRRLVAAVVACEQVHRWFGHSDLERRQIATLEVRICLRHALAYGPRQVESDAERLQRVPELIDGNVTSTARTEFRALALSRTRAHHVV